MSDKPEEKEKRPKAAMMRITPEDVAQLERIKVLIETLTKSRASSAAIMRAALGMYEEWLHKRTEAT